MDKRLMDYAARLFDIDVEVLRNPKRRTQGIVAARSALAWALLRVHPNWTRQEVATVLGMRGRDSIADYDERAEALRKADRSYQKKLDRLLLVAGHGEDLPPPPPQRSTLRLVKQPDAMAIWGVQERRGIFVRTA